MILVLFGPPGSGKGTQAKLLSERFKVPHISLGDLLREAVRDKTKVGKLAAKYLDKGLLVPDEVVNELARERYAKPDCQSGFILDGYPRTIAQAEFLGQVDKVIYLKIPLSEAIKRLSERRSCERCGKVFHLTFNPPKGKDSCDTCGGRLYLRSDDREEIVKKRFEVYQVETKPLIDYYRSRGKLKEVDGSAGLKEVFESILAVL